MEHRWDTLTGVRFLITDVHIVVVPHESLVVDQPLELPSGRLLCLQSFQESIPTREPAPVPAGQLIKVLTPEQNEVSCLGYLVVGLNVA